MLLSVDPIDFFDDDSGIYVFGQGTYDASIPYFGANFWEDWERPIHFSFYEMTVMILLNLMQELRFLVVGVEVKMVNDHFHFLREGNMEIQNFSTF